MTPPNLTRSRMSTTEICRTPDCRGPIPEMVGLDRRVFDPLPFVDTAEIDRVFRQMEASGNWADPSDLMGQQLVYKNSRPDVQARNHAEAVREILCAVAHLTLAETAMRRLELGQGHKAEQCYLAMAVQRQLNALHRIAHDEIPT